MCTKQTTGVSIRTQKNAEHTGAAAIAALGATAGIAGFRGHRTAR
jgi:hypothetical protein